MQNETKEVEPLKLGSSTRDGPLPHTHQFASHSIKPLLSIQCRLQSSQTHCYTMPCVAAPPRLANKNYLSQRSAVGMAHRLSARSSEQDEIKCDIWNSLERPTRAAPSPPTTTHSRLALSKARHPQPIHTVTRAPSLSHKSCRPTPATHLSLLRI